MSWQIWEIYRFRLFLIARICDAINDPFIGFLIDRIPTTKFGHFRKSLIVGSVLCGINFLLMWYGPLMLPAGKVVIAYITYLLLGVLFPVMDISLNSLLPVMTTNIDERNGLGALKGFFYSVGSTVIAMIALCCSDRARCGDRYYLLRGWGAWSKGACSFLTK